MQTNIKTPDTSNCRTARKLKVQSWKQEAMDVLIRANGVELTDKLRELVRRKVSRVRRYAPRALRARVQLHRMGAARSARQFQARVHCEVPGNDLVAEHRAHEPLAALDLVVDKIKGRLRRRKTAVLAGRVRAARRQARRAAVEQHV